MFLNWVRKGLRLYVLYVVERNSIELVEGVIHADLQLWRCYLRVICSSKR